MLLSTKFISEKILARRFLPKSTPVLKLRDGEGLFLVG